jgi:hypothetical protein
MFTNKKYILLSVCKSQRFAMVGRERSEPIGVQDEEITACAETKVGRSVKRERD